MQDWKKIKLIILDNDGVLTDGKLVYNNNLVESKNFNAKDGLGIKMLSFSSIKLAIITGKKSEIVKLRCEELGIKYLFQKVDNKLKIAEKLVQKLNLKWENVAYLGDDWNDYPVFRKCKLSATTADAFPTIKEKVNVILTRKGGEGAVREFIEMILQKQGIYEETVEKLIAYLESK